MRRALNGRHIALGTLLAGLSGLIGSAEAAGLPPATRAAAPPPSCNVQARGAAVVMRSSASIAFRRGVRYYGCLKATRRTTFLLRAEELGDAEDAQVAFRRLALGGDFAGLAYTVIEPSDAEHPHVRVVDLRRGRRRFDVTVFGGRAGSSEGCDGPQSAFIQSFALDARGRTAWGLNWTGELSPTPSTVCHEVWATNARGDQRRLDEGSGIDTRSVRIRGSNVTWTRGGAPRSAPLP